jgi:hypothetical protein
MVCHRLKSGVQFIWEIGHSKGFKLPEIAPKPSGPKWADSIGRAIDTIGMAGLPKKSVLVSHVTQVDSDINAISLQKGQSSSDHDRHRLSVTLISRHSYAAPLLCPRPLPRHRVVAAKPTLARPLVMTHATLTSLPSPAAAVSLSRLSISTSR